MAQDDDIRLIGPLLGIDETDEAFHDIEACYQQVLALVTQAQHQVLIYSPDFEQDLYNRLTLRTPFSELARRSRSSTINILLHSTDAIVKHTHCLVELAQRLPSHIHIRLTNPEYPSADGAFLLADDLGFMFRNEPDSYEGVVNFRDRRRVKILQESFHEMWTRSREAVALRRLYI